MFCFQDSISLHVLLTTKHAI